MWSANIGEVSGLLTSYTNPMLGPRVLGVGHVLVQTASRPIHPKTQG